MSSRLNNVSGRGCGGATVRGMNAGSCRKPENTSLKLTSLAAIVRDYLIRFQPEHEQELTWFRNQASLEDALRLASRAEDGQGHRYKHQRRIRSRAIMDASRALTDAHDDLRKCTLFHQLWSLVGSSLAAIKGVRELYVYDCALRLGAHLGLQPEKVYLHAGTRVGAKNLGLLSRKNARKQWLEPTELPPALRKLPASDVENLLCIYQTELAQLKRPD